MAHPALRATELWPLPAAASVELRNALSSRFGVDLAPTVTLDYPTVAALTAHIAAELPQPSSPSTSSSESEVSAIAPHAHQPAVATHAGRDPAFRPAVNQLSLQIQELQGAKIKASPQECPVGKCWCVRQDSPFDFSVYSPLQPELLDDQPLQAFSGDPLPADAASRFGSQLSQHLAATEQLASTLQALLAQQPRPVRAVRSRRAARGEAAAAAR